MRHWRTVLLIVPLTLLTLSGGVWAAPDPDETRLNTTQRQIDRQGTPPSSEALAKEFNVSTATVDGLRAKKQGWGETTIELAMAQQLTKTNPTAYPTMDAALTKIEGMRAEKRGWGKIANDLGFKLGPVVSSVQRARHDVSSATRPGAKAETKTRPERGMRSERPERPERSERPERGGRP